jgi:hypothetical protein
MSKMTAESLPSTITTADREKRLQTARSGYCHIWRDGYYACSRSNTGCVPTSSPCTHVVFVLASVLGLLD